MIKLGKKTKGKIPACKHQKETLATGTLEALSRYEKK